MILVHIEEEICKLEWHIMQGIIAYSRKGSTLCVSRCATIHVRIVISIILAMNFLLCKKMVYDLLQRKAKRRTLLYILTNSCL